MFAPGDGSSALAGLNGKDTPEKNKKKKKNKEKTGSLYNNSVLHLLSPYASPVQHFSFVFFVLSFIVRGRRQLGRKNKNKNKKEKTLRKTAGSGRIGVISARATAAKEETISENERESER